MAYPTAVQSLIDAFRLFPGIGAVTAERLAFHVLRDGRARDLARAIDRAVKEARRCQVCGNVSEVDPCRLCSDESRDRSLLAVVEEPRHVEALENAGVYRGSYHVLMGALNPADGTEASHLGLESLLDRLKPGNVEEVILATDPDAEGEATAQLVLEAIEALGDGALRVSRLARGLPAGGAIEYLHKGILEDALNGRRELRLRPGRSGG